MPESVVIFGAGRIGRSFLGPVFSRAGLPVTFVDAVPDLIDALNATGAYRVIQLSPEGAHRTDRVAGVRAVHAGDLTAVRAAAASASIICTAVGMRSFAAVVEQIAAALAGIGGAGPVDRNLILAENINGAGDMARRILQRHRVPLAPAPGGIGVIETSIGKMVPAASPPGLAIDSPLDVAAEAYNTLIVDRRGWAGPFPVIDGLLGVDNITAYVDRKLFVHNFGHAAAAYLGALGCPKARYVAEALEDRAIRDQVQAVMLASAAALAAEYPRDLAPADLTYHVEDLVRRFRNPYLHDSLARVGRDLPRKLARDDRVVGAMLLMARHGLDLTAPAAVYHAALRFSPAPGYDDGLLSEDVRLQEELAANGLPWVLERYSGLGPPATGPDAVVRAAILQAGA